MPDAWARARAEAADLMGDLSCEIDLVFWMPWGRGPAGFGTLKLVWNKTSRVEPSPNGSVDVEVREDLAGMGFGPSGLMVACILASEEAVGAYSREEVTEAVNFGRAVSEGGGGAGLAFLRMSAWLCLRMEEDMLDEGLGRPRVLTELAAALLLPIGPKSGILDRARDEAVDMTV